jgi:hypothetical protein
MPILFHDFTIFNPPFFFQEHVIFIWFEPMPKFHNKLINCYREKVQLLMKEYLDSLQQGLYLHHISF